MGTARCRARAISRRASSAPGCASTIGVPEFERRVDLAVIGKIDEDAPAKNLLDVLAEIVRPGVCVIQNDVDVSRVDAEGLEQQQGRLGPAHGAEVVAGDKQDAVSPLESLQHELVDV